MLRNIAKTGILSVLVLVSLSVTATQARFLQADPVGSKDDLNLYAYVRNDPVNKTDPSGLTCTFDSGGQVQSCQLDKGPDTRGMNLDEKSLVEHQVKDFNKRYTATVKNLLSGGKSATLALKQMLAGGKVGDSNVTAKITAQEVGTALANRTIAFDPSSSNPHTDSLTNTTYIPRSVLVGNAAPMYGDVPAGNRGSNIVLVHEGIHGTQTERDLVRRAGGQMEDLQRGNPWGLAHQQPYDEAAEGLYGGGP